MEFNLKIRALTYHDNELWGKMAAYAAACSWQETGAYLSSQMKRKAFSGWERVFVALIDNTIAGFCALTKTCSLRNISYAPFLGFVFVDEVFRGNRISEKLCMFAIQYAKTTGFDKVYLYSDLDNLYEKYGFVKIDEKEAPWGEMQSIYMHST